MSKKSFKLFTIIVLASFLTSCISTNTVRISDADLSVMRGKTVAIIHNEKPSFGAITPTNMVISTLTGGIAGYFTMTYQGNKIIRENEVADPAFVISSNLAKNVSQKYGVKIIDERTTSETQNISKISKQYRDISDYVLAVGTADWAINYLRGNLSRYRVLYVSRVELINTKTGKIIAEGSCSKNPSQKEINNPPTYDELLRNKAAAIKEELAAIGPACASLFGATVFNFPSQ